MLEFIQQPWPWYISGLVITLVMSLLLFFGKSFGFSGNLMTACSALGAGKKVKFFDYDWRNQRWNLLFAFGSLIGGFIAHKFLSNGEGVQISESTLTALAQWGFEKPTGINPTEIFSWSFLATPKGFVLLLGGGILIGFGARYAGGCTSGHAISGLSDLQIPSLIAVVGFFIGGLIMTHLLMPLIF